MRPDRLLYGPFNERFDKASTIWLDKHSAQVFSLYRNIHSHPELSGHEKRTSRILAARLKSAGLKVLEGVGGYGVVGILSNGAGPTVLIRADMDALPVEEETGLPYASRTRGVMHACGHDVHTATLAAVAKVFSENRPLWRGTAVFVGQPSEETASGAQAMVDDPRWKRVPRPGACLGLHVDADVPVGRISLVSGWFTANTDSIDVIIHGKGGHGARPHEAEDPIVAAAQVIVALQTIVTRRVDPIEPVVITVGSIHAGQKHNIIPDRAVMQLTVRTFSPKVRRQVLSHIKEAVADASRAAGCRARPEVKTGVEFTAALYNDPRLCEHARSVFTKIIGRGKVVAFPPTTGGEDFSVYVNALRVPCLLYGVGAVSPRPLGRFRSPAGRPALHSSRFAPVAQPTLRMCVRSMCALAASLMGRP